MGKFGKTGEKSKLTKQAFDDFSIRVKNEPPEEKKKQTQTMKTIRPKTNEMTKVPDDKYYLYLMTYKKDVEHYGQTETFSFKIRNSEIFEPLVISVYERKKKETKKKERYNSSLFITNLFFDKNKLLKVYEKGKGSNILIYGDEFLNKILSKMSVKDRKLKIEDIKLKSCLIK